MMKTVADLRVKIFADGADRAGMLEMAAKPYIKGLTTNPTLMSKAGVTDYETFAKEVVSAIPDLPLSFEVISDDFDSMEKFKERFLQTAVNLFGSGWVWLSINTEGSLIIEARSNADNPILDGHRPLLTCDVWEHAYYIDYRNARPAYLEKWWGLVNWDFVSQNLKEGL